mmetsp:Transcript_61309/g.150063  ORF Transcript_61309/g.150063 Transcript_61309/m.150063 type:complete len:355 (-) Transcript_61309:430-1494(-)
MTGQEENEETKKPDGVKKEDTSNQKDDDAIEEDDTANVEANADGDDGGGEEEAVEKDSDDADADGDGYNADVADADSNKDDEEEETKEEEESSSSRKQPDDTTIDFQRPAKKGRTAYFIFTDERRKEVAAMHPGQPVSVVAKVLGQEWKAMDDETKAKYQERSVAEKEKYETYMKEALARGEKFPELEAGAGSGTSGPLDLVFPAAKVRKICKLDPEVKNVSREALQLIVKASELFTTAIGKESVKVARFNNRRKLLPEDVAHVCVHRSAFTFLKDDVKDLVKWQREAARKEKKQKEAAAAAASAAAAAAGVGTSGDGVDHDNNNGTDGSGGKKDVTKPLTDYFSSSATAAASK